MWWRHRIPAGGSSLRGVPYRPFRSLRARAPLSFRLRGSALPPSRVVSRPRSHRAHALRRCARAARGQCCTRPVASWIGSDFEAQGSRTFCRRLEGSSMSRDVNAVALSGVALLGLVALAVKPKYVSGRASPRRARLLVSGRTIDPSAAVRSARRMNRAAGVLATAVLADSAVEHYRGSFHNKAMVAPLVTAALSLAVSAHGNADKRPIRHR